VCVCVCVYVAISIKFASVYQKSSVFSFLTLERYVLALNFIIISIVCKNPCGALAVDCGELEEPTKNEAEFAQFHAYGGKKTFEGS